MPRFRHVVLPTGSEKAEPYVSTRSGGPVDFPTPPRDRVPHARKLRGEVETAKRKIAETVASQSVGQTVENICIECFSDPDKPLKLESLEDRRSGIELLAVRHEDDRTFATIFIPEGSLESFVRKIERYETENDKRRSDGGPKNKDLVESICGIRVPVVRSFFTDQEDLFPGDTEPVWWEVWLRVPPNESDDESFARFMVETEGTGIRLSEQVVSFPERIVFLAFGSPHQWAQSLSLLLRVAELRRAKEVPTELLELDASDQGLFVKDGARRVRAAPESAPVVCLLDTGVNRDHPLLEQLVAEGDVQAVHPDWAPADEHGHGTQMAGVVGFGDKLAEHLSGNSDLEFPCRLESVKILHPVLPNDPDNYGFITTEAIAMAEIRSPRSDRVACMAITADDRDGGLPSLWSAAIDQHSAGALDDKRRLYVLAAGNLTDVASRPGEYPRVNHQHSVNDPAQSWNALTVGAHTDLVQIRSQEFSGYKPIAPRGGLSPASRTSLTWDEREWPLKPDIVMEGGNYVQSPEGEIDFCDDLALLTTAVHPTGRLLDIMKDTSAATAQAARFAATLMASYPDLWPETVRGLMVHSAEWTEQMKVEFPATSKDDLQNRLRCYGFGVPDIEKALWTIGNQVSLVYQGHLQPFQLDEGRDKTCEYHLHDLPWPRDVLESLGEKPASIRITLSYFIEPSPGRRGWNRKFRYASHGLRFALRGPTESNDEFEQRITREAWNKEEDRPSTAEPEQQNWDLGSMLRTRGSIHSDSWTTATAAELAACGRVAVYPVTGWWRERKHLGRIEHAARYALIITIGTPETTVDLYTPIAQQVGIVAEIEGS